MATGIEIRFEFESSRKRLRARLNLYEFDSVQGSRVTSLVTFGRPDRDGPGAGPGPGPGPGPAVRPGREIGRAHV